MVSRLVELETEAEEIAGDRRALTKIAVGAAGLGAAEAMIVRKGTTAGDGGQSAKMKAGRKTGPPLTTPAPPVKGRKKKVATGVAPGSVAPAHRG